MKPIRAVVLVAAVASLVLLPALSFAQQQSNSQPAAKPAPAAQAAKPDPTGSAKTAAKPKADKKVAKKAHKKRSVARKPAKASGTVTTAKKPMAPATGSQTAPAKKN